MRLYWWIQSLGWLLFVSGTLFYNYWVNDAVSKTDLLFAFLLFIFGILGSHVIKIYAKKRNWLVLPLYKLFPYFALTSFVLACITYLCSVGIITLLSNTWINTLNWETFLSFVPSFAIVFFVWCLIYFLFSFFKNFKKEEIKNLKKESEMNAMMFNLLKSQLNPHFMFNSMNVIRALIDEDQNKAKEGIGKLSNILRKTLSLDQEKLISLKEEMDLVQDYIDLEVMRFEDRLNFTADVQKEVLSTKIPPMLLQTLVENAIKHGISKEVNGGRVYLFIKLHHNKVLIQIENPGKFFPSNKGKGLKNSAQRLQYIFGNQASIKVYNEDNKVITKLYLPK